MVNDNPGYSYERLAFCNLEGVPQSSRKALMDEILKQGEVEDVTTCYELPAFPVRAISFIVPVRRMP